MFNYTRSSKKWFSKRWKCTLYITSFWGTYVSQESLCELMWAKRSVQKWSHGFRKGIILKWIRKAAPFQVKDFEASAENSQRITAAGNSFFINDYFVQVDEEDGPILGTIVRNHFRSINIVRGVTKSKSSHRQSLIM